MAFSGTSRKRLMIAGVGVGLLCVAIIAASYALAPVGHGIVRRQLEELLQAHFQSSVQFSDFDVVLFPRLRLVVTNLVLRHQGRTDIPPLIEVRQLTVDGSLSTLLGRRHEIARARLDGLQMHTPPRSSEGPSLIHATDTDLAKKYPILIDEVDADDALVVLLRKPSDSGKPPNEFAIHQLVMHDVGFDRPAIFHAVLTNPKPRGEIHCDGQFGPWRADEPSETPVSANYDFFNADLGTFKGLRGALSSTGKFSGPLDYLNVEGTTDTPDFGLRTTSHPMALETDFTAIVDGTNGNTILTNVTAKFLHTTLVTHGQVVDVYPNVKGRTIALDATANDARVEDLLTLAVKSDQPVMTGSAELKTKILIPEGDEDLVDRLQLDGRFGLGKVHFTNSGVQGKIDSLSRKGQGKPKDMAISDQLSDLKGHFTMQKGDVTFSNLNFGVEGVSVALTGNYNLDSGQMDFHGKLRLQAKLSQTTTGWKSVLLKPFDSLFQGNHSGTEVPIKITGTRENPSFGYDF